MKPELCCLPILLALWPPVSVGAEQSRHVIFNYDVRVLDLPPDARRVDVWLPVPPETPQQRIRGLEIQAPVPGVRTTERAYGNRIWHAVFRPPFGRALHVSERVEVVRFEQRTRPADRRRGGTARGPGSSTDLSLFLKANRMVPITDRFLRIASARTRGSRPSLARCRALYDYVLERMSYDKSGQGWGRGDANYACDIGKGNCTDFHSLFIALTRSLKIPARFWIGFPLPEKRGKGRVGGYHCWAEFWVEGTGWVPVDISEADKHPDKTDYFFGNIDENRIAFSLGRDITLSEQQQGPPINFFVYPYVEVDGKPWTRLAREFTYEDVRRTPNDPGEPR